MPNTSRIYVQFKALGYVSNHVPVVTRYIKMRKENLLVTCVGKSFHTYGCSHFKLLSVSGLHPEEISCMTADNYLVFTAAGKSIYAWRRGCELKHEYKGHQHNIHLLLAFGPHLISIDEESCLKMWNIKTEELILDLEFNNLSFEITTMMHPSTYLNKILLGSHQGSLQLWNLHTTSLLYTFKGWGSGVNVIEQTPAVDIVGIGLQNGKIILHNLKFDEVVMEFQQDWGIVTSLTFRSDNHPIMISGTMQGHIVLWNLEERKVFAQLLNAHDGMVASLTCLPSEPLIVSSSPDNSLKLWIFDMSDGSARMLRVREGHSLPPSFVRFYDSQGQNLLSAGADSCLRIFNTTTETFNKSLGRASYNRKVSKKKGLKVEDPLKMPPIMKFAFETTREKEWDNIAAIHTGIPEVTTWSYGKLKMGELKLIHERFVKNKKVENIKFKATPTSIHLTHCGNFALIGYSSGHCDRYNIQSGQHRATYGNDKAHEGPVRGILTDMLNKFVLTGGSDRLVKWWFFNTRTKNEEIRKLELEDGVSFFVQHVESSIVAVALENFSVVLIDNDGKVVIRKFQGHTCRLTDAAFSPDARWLITSGMDCMIYTWDIPSGMLVDQFKVDAACTSLSFSPTGELLATTHVDYLGVFLWMNKTLYTHVSLKPITDLQHVPLMDLPSGAREQDKGMEIDDDDEEEEPEAFESAQQIENLITKSNLANSRWQNLLNIDLIKKRNKPKEPPKASTAPFFLPTVPSLDIRFDFSDVAKEKEKENSSKISLLTSTVFGKLLNESTVSNNYNVVFEKLKSMGPSSIEFEIKNLSAEVEHSEILLLQFMKMIKFVFDNNVDFELAQAYLALFLKVHGETIMNSRTLKNYLEELKDGQLNGWQRLQDLLFYNLSVIKELKS